MKTKYVYVIFLSILFSLNSCEEYSRQMKAEETKNTESLKKVLGGKHLLRKIYSEKETERSASGGFFIFAGNYNSSEKTETTVTFSWQTNRGDYVYYTLPLVLGRVRLRIDNSVKQPQVVFSWNQNKYTEFRSDDVEKAYYQIEYATFIVRDGDWPVDIAMPR